MQARYYDPVIGRFLSADPVGFAQGGPAYFNRYAYVHNDPINKIDPNGEATIHVQAKVELKAGGVLRNVAERVSGRPILAGGGSISAGVAISFPAGDGAKFDAGVTGGIGATDLKQEGSGQSLPSLPGVKGGGTIGISQGSVSDLSGQEFSGQVQSNIGKGASNAIVDAVAGALPDGAAKNAVNGSVRKAANGLAGFVASAGVTSGDNGTMGVEVGLAKGLNVGVSADVENTRVCSLADGCN